MPAPLINRTVLMSGPEHFAVEELNPYEHSGDQPDIPRAVIEHHHIREALESAGVTVRKVAAPPGCPDGVYTANWALVRGDTAVMSSLPPQRQGEQPHAEETLRSLSKRIVKAPYKFSGQGDALPCGNLLFCGSHYRTDPRMHKFLAKELGYQVIGLEPVPALDRTGKPIINKLTGWPDSYFYDLDLGLSVLTPDLIGWCPEAFTPESQEKIRALKLDKIEVSLGEAIHGFACNLVSTGYTVVMSAHALRYRAAIEARGLKTIPTDARELAKGGGFIRCTTITLDNA
jgi:N-dimethylarginine dimethylaminohydrolase